MTIPHVELALGTAQFGMKYGIMGCGKPVSPNEVREIFARASTLGIRVIDTAPAYGDIEERLHAFTEGYRFDIVSKIPAVPSDKGSNAVFDFVASSVLKSLERLGTRLRTVLFHRGQDLLDQYGDTAWKAACEAISNSPIQLGISCYSPQELEAVCAEFPIKVAQVPGNALDQRLMSVKNINGIELHLRSVFLQGILLADLDTVSIRLPRAAKATAAWRHWCQEHNLSLLEGALSIAKGLPGVRYCVVGVDNVAQLEHIWDAWTSAVPISAPDLATHDQELIDPRRWYSKNEA